MANTENLWQELSISALLGTRRRAFTSPEASGGLGSALRAAAGAGDEARLLRAASLASVYRRAGLLPSIQDVTLPPACPQDEWPRCSLRAGGLLETILNGDLTDLLPEWVALATCQQQRIREEHLALLLDQPKASQPLRKALLPVLGERGRWLARLNPDWQGFDLYTSQSTWFEGARKERILFLSDLRECQPGRARHLLSETWPEESSAERLAFLQALEVGLSMEDEPFLETVLDDRRKDVRSAAAALLGQLPASRLVKRMTGRAQALLAWKTILLRSTLDVTLPETCDEGMQRDGIDPKGQPKAGLGGKSNWLAQILACVPPSTWSKTWNRKPEQILAVIHRHKDEAALYLGWQAAAQAFQDTDWLEALLVYDLRRTNRTTQPGLFSQLPEALREKHMINLLREQPSLAYDQPASVYLSACRFTWSQELTRDAVQVICAHLHKGDLNPWRWERLLRDIAPYPHPDLLGEAIDHLTAALSRRAESDPSVVKLLSILHFRLEMQRAFLP
jgi:hypothetical protein